MGGVTSRTNNSGRPATAHEALDTRRAETLRATSLFNSGNYVRSQGTDQQSDTEYISFLENLLGTPDCSRLLQEVQEDAKRLWVKNGPVKNILELAQAAKRSAKTCNKRPWQSLSGEFELVSNDQRDTVSVLARIGADLCSSIQVMNTDRMQECIEIVKMELDKESSPRSTFVKLMLEIVTNLHSARKGAVFEVCNRLAETLIGFDVRKSNICGSIATLICAMELAGEGGDEWKSNDMLENLLKLPMIASARQISIGSVIRVMCNTDGSTIVVLQGGFGLRWFVAGDAKEHSVALRSVPSDTQMSVDGNWCHLLSRQANLVYSVRLDNDLLTKRSLDSLVSVGSPVLAFGDMAGRLTIVQKRSKSLHVVYCRPVSRMPSSTQTIIINENVQSAEVHDDELSVLTSSGKTLVYGMASTGRLCLVKPDANRKARGASRRMNNRTAHADFVHLVIDSTIKRCDNVLEMLMTRLLMNNFQLSWSELRVCTDENLSSLELAIQLIETGLRDTCLRDFLPDIMAIGLNMLALNVVVATKRNQGLPESDRLQNDRFSEVKRIIRLLSSTLIIENERTMTCFCRLLAVSIDLYDHDHDEFGSVVASLAANKTIAVRFAKSLAAVKNQGVILYALTPAMVLVCERELERSVLWQVLASAIEQVHEEILFIKASTHPHTIIPFIEAAIECCERNAEELMCQRYCASLLLELITVDNFRAMASSIVPGTISLMKKMVSIVPTANGFWQASSDGSSLEISIPGVSTYFSLIYDAKKDDGIQQKDWDKIQYAALAFDGTLLQNPAKRPNVVSNGNSVTMCRVKDGHARLRFEDSSQMMSWARSALCKTERRTVSVTDMMANDLLLRVGYYFIGCLLSACPDTQIASKEGDKKFEKILDLRLFKGLSLELLEQALSNESKMDSEQERSDKDQADLGEDELRQIAISYVDRMHGKEKNRAINSDKQLVNIEIETSVALMRHLDLLRDMEFEQKKVDEQNTTNRCMPTEPVNSTLWQAVRTVRNHIIRSRQQLKLNEDTFPSEYQRLLHEISTRIRLLSLTDPILRQTGEKCEVGSETVKVALHELCSFITSDVCVSDLRGAFRQWNEQEAHQTEQSQWLWHVFSDNAIPLEMKSSMLIPELFDNDQQVTKPIPTQRRLWGDLADLVTGECIDRTTQLIVVSYLAKIGCAMPMEKIADIFERLTTSVAQNVDRGFCMQVYKMFALWAVQTPSQSVTWVCLKLASSSTDKLFKHRLLLMTILMLEKSTDSKVKVQDVLKCLTDVSPRVAVTVIRLLTLAMERSSGLEKERFVIRTKQTNSVMNLQQFVVFVLRGIGQTLSGGGCLFIDADCIQESHVFVANEMISMVRSVLRTGSMARDSMTRILHGVLAKCKDINLDKDDLAVITGLFAVLGKEIASFTENGWALHLSRDPQVERVAFYDNVTGRIEGIDHAYEQSDTSAAFYPSSRVMTDPREFTLETSESELIMRVHNWAERQFENPTLAQMALIVHFYGFVTVGLQDTASMESLMKGSDITSLLELASSHTGEKIYRNLPKEMAKIGKVIMNAAKLSRRLKTCDNRKIGNGLVSPVRFLSLQEGKVSPDVIECGANSPGWFVGDISLPIASSCQYELTVLAIDGDGLRVGFIGERTDLTGGCNFSGFDSREKAMISQIVFQPCDPDIKITRGTVIGCAYGQGGVTVSINGVEIGAVPVPMGSSVIIPTVFSSCKELKLGYSFKRKRSSANKEMDTLKKPTAVAKPKPMEKSSSSEGAQTEDSRHTTVRFKTLYFGVRLEEVPGRPVVVRDEAVALHGTICSFHSNDGAPMIEMVDAAENVVRTQEVKRSQLVTSSVTIGDIVSYLGHNTDTGKESTEALYNDDMLKLKELVRSYCVRMLRYFCFSVIDYYRRSGQLQVFLSKPLTMDLMKLLLYEVFETTLTPGNGKCGVVEDVRCFFEDKTRFMLPGDAYSFSQYMKALCMNNPMEMVSVLENVSKTALSRLMDHCDDISDVFNSTDKSARLEFPHPCPETDLLVQFGNTDAIGYIPVLAPEHDIASSVFVNQRGVKNICDCCFIPGGTAEVVMIDPQSERFGVRCGFFCVTKYLYEGLYKTKIGDMHIVSAALNIMQASRMGDAMWRQVQKSVFKSMASDTEHHFFANVFSLNMIRSLPSRLSVSDLLETETTFIRRKCDCVEKMEPQSMSTQATLILAALGEIASRNIQVAQMVQQRSTEKATIFYDLLTLRNRKKESSVPEQMIDLLALCVGIGSHARSENGFPAHLMVELWISYGNPQWSELSVAAEDRRSYFVNHYQEFCKELDLMSTQWSEESDEQLGWMMQRDESLVTQNPLVSSDVLDTLFQFPPRVVYCRIHLLKRLNESFDTLSIVGGMNEGTIFGSIVRPVMSWTPFARKAGLIRKAILQKCNSSSGCTLYLSFNREKARKFHDQPGDTNGESLLSQFIGQMNDGEHNVDLMNRSCLAWKVNFIGENACDQGGPRRDAFTETCLEIMDPSLDLFIPTPNQQNRDGPNQDLLIPNPKLLESTSERQYYYAGILIATAFEASHNIPFRFARFVWRALIDDSPIDISEIYAIDSGFGRLMKSLEQCHEKVHTDTEFTSLFPYCFETRNSRGEMVELIPNGSKTKVTFEKRMEYVQKCKQFRQMEMEPQLAALREGFRRFIPSSLSELMRPRDLQLLVCGPEQCPIEMMQKHFSVNGSDAMVKLLWKTLASFTVEERLLFIKFGSGRMGLPAPGVEAQPILIVKIEKSDRADKNKRLPHASTCGATIYMEDYSNEHWMALKLRAAIRYANEING